MNWLEKQQAQCAYIADYMGTLTASLATLTSAVNLTANGTLIAKMNAVNGDYDDVKEALNGAADLLADHNNVDISIMSGGTDCTKKYAPGI